MNETKHTKANESQKGAQAVDDSGLSHVLEFFPEIFLYRKPTAQMKQRKDRLVKSNQQFWV